jgi:hypothetical protein
MTITHRQSGTRFYKIWKGIQTRCYNEKCKAYKNYGGRGIFADERWKKFENFRDDMHDSYEKHIEKYGKENTSIDRIYNNLSYYKDNCKWSTRKEQNSNKRMHKLTKEKVIEIRKKYRYGQGIILAKEYGVNKAVISEIINFKRNYAKIK